MDQGAVQGPEEFAEGLVIGVRSLFGHTVGAYDLCVYMYVIITLKCIVFGKQVVICSKREFLFLLISECTFPFFHLGRDFKATSWVLSVHKLGKCALKLMLLHLMAKSHSNSYIYM